ncbi:hypothetical protein HNY73_004901 [Argiope bruennichi]|uniref:Uncharacterized protein n=1 Tax=Argiope bruennichi TaxID=94029 RepID=A0A8T0FUS8_ARGBR|nr:hypothetical protein HNY73_004901 [Argiope bruennichi]
MGTRLPPSPHKSRTGQVAVVIGIGRNETDLSCPRGDILKSSALMMCLLFISSRSEMDLVIFCDSLAALSGVGHLI